MRYLFLVISIWSCFTLNSEAQLYLQLERSGSLKTKRYSIGDVIVFQLRNDEAGWYERQISHIDVPNNRIVFPDVMVPVDSIAAIRLTDKLKGIQIVGSALQVGGANVMLFVAYESIFRDTKFDWGGIAIGALNIAVGSALKAIFRYRTFRVGGKKRLRLLDLNFGAPQDPWQGN